jgi:hypothetical protein
MAVAGSLEQFNAVSPLERVFEFEDPDFRRYMSLESRSRGTFRELSDLMGSSDHPIVQYAAGWAAAEAATFRDTKVGRGFGRLPARRDMLEQAEAHWREASRQMPGLREAQTSEGRALEVRDIEVRLAQSLAYLPLMDVVASWMSRSSLNKRKTETRLQEVRSSALDLGALTLGLPENTVQERCSKSGLMSEMAFALVSQVDGLQGYLTLPASFRQENNRFSAMRADFVAITARPSHQKTLVQVKSGSRPPGVVDPLDMIYFYAKDDLTIEGGRRAQDTVNAFIQWEAGLAADDTASSLRGLGRVMTRRLDDFQAKRAARG